MKSPTKKTLKHTPTKNKPTKIRSAKNLSSERVKEIKKRFLDTYKDAKTELIYTNIYELLVCVMLSAQCTDKRVNIVTPALFKKYPTPATLANANVDDIKELIKSVSFFNNKAANLKKMATQVMRDFGGEIPTTQEELKSLAGVGQKTANVVLIEFFEANYMAVDTHCFRVSHRLGLSTAKSALETESELSTLFKDNLSTLHQAFVLFGRYICKALNPQCLECFVSDLCKNKQNFKPR